MRITVKPPWNENKTPLGLFHITWLMINQSDVDTARAQ